ncbi:MAG TPA: hypothetical protein VG963_25360 [Polyangiaceae bacterium]|nr:hypothetical protein [Polyangiaceae bacterium]
MFSASKPASWQVRKQADLGKEHEVADAIGKAGCRTNASTENG